MTSRQKAMHKFVKYVHYFGYMDILQEDMQAKKNYHNNKNAKRHFANRIKHQEAL
jgi:uncharacterized sporulation protein YeaH/YhbH (DUF444 family)